jgi:hypothetical protein
MRDDFTEEVKRTLAARAGGVCSNPDCRALTSGPQVDSTKALNVGVAAHITGASEGGPRYDPKLSPDERRHPDNGIWLCQTCAKCADNDTSRFTEKLLRAWKEIAEVRALGSIGKTVSPVHTELQEERQRQYRAEVLRERNITLKNMLGVAIQKGEQVYAANDQKLAEEWATETRELITKALGTGEATLFLSDSGYTFFSGPGRVKNWVDGRLRRLGELIRSLDTIAT